MHQRTIKQAVSCQGVGLHSGALLNLKLLPATAGAGITFIRTDVTDKDNRIAARWDCVVDTRLCTVLANRDGVSVGTVEHIMAALRGAEIHNVTIELDGAEVPIMDGSSAAFVELIDRAGVEVQGDVAYAIKILHPVTVTEGNKSVTLSPAPVATYTGEIEFAHPSIGQQKYGIQLLNGNFRHDLADSRTFGFYEEVTALRAMGLAKGGSLENAIVLDQDAIMNPEGLRHEDEFIRHKLLDAVGDIYLAGAPVIGAYHGVRPSHALNNAALRALFADRDAWAVVPLAA